METDFLECSIAHGFKFSEFKKLDDSMKKKVIKLLSRVMEAAYRRGVQQALTVPSDRLEPKLLEEGGLWKWRYENSLDKSVGIDFFNSKSKERLFMEHGCLRDIGFTD